MTFRLEIKSESELDKNNKVFPDEEEAILAAIKKKCMVAYW